MKSRKIQTVNLLFPNQLTIDDISACLSSHFSLKKEAEFKQTLSLFDSFEWGFFYHDLLLVKNQPISNKGSFQLLPKNKLFDHLFINEPQQHLIANKTQPRFWWDFDVDHADSLETKASENFTTLKKILDLRAIMPLTDLNLKKEEFEIQDAQGKTVCNCELIRAFLVKQPDDALLFNLKLTSITGYSKELSNISQLLKKIGGFSSSQNQFDSFFKALGLKPTPFDIKPQIQLDPKTPARQTANHIVSTMIAKQRQTEQGIIDDIDTEFLHHYRVALRMIKAVVTQLKDVYQTNDVIDLKVRFGSLAKRTNLLRDIDVFILDKERYINLLPPALQSGLLPLFNDFERKRKVELKQVTDWLSHQDYLEEMTSLENLFSNDFSSAETQWSESPSIILAVTKIKKRYKKIYLAAITITSETPDDAIHDIRLECKKLRYLLYFFSSLFDKKQIKIVLKHLKQLQDLLGIFNDLCVQGEFLADYLNQLIQKKSTDKSSLCASLGGLIAVLHEMQLKQRQTCINELCLFASEEVQQLVNKTFVIPTELSIDN